MAPLTDLPENSVQYTQALMSLKWFVENLTEEDVKSKATEWPEGEGDYYLLPTRVL